MRPVAARSWAAVKALPSRDAGGRGVRGPAQGQGRDGGRGARTPWGPPTRRKPRERPEEQTRPCSKLGP